MCDAKVTTVNMMYKAFITAFLPILVSSNFLNQRSLPQPSIETEDMQFRVEAPAGTTVHLACPVRDLGTKNVVWFKGNIILSIGVFRWTTNERLTVSSETSSSISTYTLTITDVTADDSGSYYCGVTNRRSRRSPPIELVVADPIDPTGPVPAVEMTGVTFVDLNDQIVLNCQMPQGVDGPLTWYKDGDTVVPTDTDNSSTTINQVNATSNTGASSALMISQASIFDTGMYICVGTLGGTRIFGTIPVHVLLTQTNNVRRGHVPRS